MVTEQEVKDVIEQVMGISVASIDPKKPLKDISEWDSFNNLMLISNFQDTYNIEFTTAELESAQTISDVIALVMAKV